MTTPLNTCRFVYILILAIGLVVAQGSAEVFQARKVVVSGGAIPGGGGTFCTFNINSDSRIAQIDEHGKVVFRLATDDGSGCSRPGIWAEGGIDGHSPVLRPGDPAPGIPGAYIWAIIEWAYGGNGLVGSLAVTAWLADVNGDLLPEDEDTAVFLGNRGSVTKLFREGEQAPGFPAGVTMYYFLEPHANPLGQTLFSANLRGPGITVQNRASYWLGTPGGIELVVRAGDPAPGGGRFDGFGSGHPYPWVSLGDDGRVAFAGQADGVPGLWQYDGGGLDALARAGDTAFGDASHTLAWIYDPSYALVGDLALQARVDGATDGIWTRVPGATRRVALEGTVAPAGGYYFLLYRPTVNAFGRVAFKAILAGFGYDDTALFAELFDQPGAPTRIAIEGQAAPGTEAGTVFADFPADAPMINALDQVVFKATLKGPMVNPSNDRGVWIFEPTSSTLTLLAREGHDLEILPGDVRTVDVLDLPTNVAGGSLHVGLARTINDKGEVLIFASFTDGSTGIVVARGQDLSTVFADGFEDGGTGSWSNVVP